MDERKRLERLFFERPSAEAAAALIGCTLTTVKDGSATSGRIVETEAYGGADDLASHAAIYRHSRTEIMSGPAGIAYVYRSYGVHACFNVVARSHGNTGAVLIRAVEPIDGLDTMRERRGTDNLRLLCSGPGRLTQALAITLADNGRDVVADDTILIEVGEVPSSVVATHRVGISRDLYRLWRFCDADSNYLSRRPLPISEPPSLGAKVSA